MQIVTAGTPKEFDMLYRANYDNGKPTYYRLCRDANSVENEVILGKANIIKKGNKLTVIAVGPMLETAIQATEGLDVTVLYYASVAPFDCETLVNNCPSGKVLICEPYYEGGLLYDVIQTLHGRVSYIDTFGLPHEFCEHYGTTHQNMEYWHRTVKDLHDRVTRAL